jgi:tetratricopeptide (TPR) repeat protein
MSVFHFSRIRPHISISRVVSIFLLLPVLLQPGRSQDRQIAASPTTAELLVRGFDALRSSPAEALPIFEEIVRKDSLNLLARKQLGSIYLNLGRPSDALPQFESAWRMYPTDSTLLQIAYLYNSLGENGKALALFGSLRGSKNSDMAAVARRAIDILTPSFCEERSQWWTRGSGSVYREGRLDDVIALLSLQRGRYLSQSRLTSLYGVLTLSADSRSRDGELPVIYSDNYGLAGLGFRLQPIRAWTIDVQEGVAYDILSRPGKKRTEADFRALTSLGTGYFAPVDVPYGLRAPFAPFADGFVSFGYYSRYEDAIGYSQARIGVRALGYRHTALDLYLRGDFTFDTQAIYYNNTAEGSIGARLIPDYRWGINLLVEYHRGAYWVDPPYGQLSSRWYNTFRLILVVDRYLCL